MNRYAVASFYKFDLSAATRMFENIKTDQSSFEDIFVLLVKETT
jgi:hypothetical protein